MEELLKSKSSKGLTELTSQFYDENGYVDGKIKRKKLKSKFNLLYFIFCFHIEFRLPYSVLIRGRNDFCVKIKLNNNYHDL